MWGRRPKKMDRRGTERVDWSRGEGEVNVTKRGQAVTEVGQIQDRISTATEEVLSTRTNLAAVFEHFVKSFTSMDIMLPKPGGHSHVNSKWDTLSKERRALQTKKNTRMSKWGPEEKIEPEEIQHSTKREKREAWVEELQDSIIFHVQCRWLAGEEWIKYLFFSFTLSQQGPFWEWKRGFNKRCCVGKGPDSQLLQCGKRILRS